MLVMSNACDVLSNLRLVFLKRNGRFGVSSREFGVWVWFESSFGVQSAGVLVLSVQLQYLKTSVIMEKTMQDF